jgi:excisionase family DNA binding protein
MRAADDALLLDISQVAALLNVSPRLVENLIRGRDLSPVRVGRCRRVTREAVNDYVDRLVAEQLSP